MGGCNLGGRAKAAGVARKRTPETQFGGCLTTGVELFQYFNDPSGLTGMHMVIVSSACHLAKNLKFHHFCSCPHIVYKQQHSFTSHSGK